MGNFTHLSNKQHSINIHDNIQKQNDYWMSKEGSLEILHLGQINNKILERVFYYVWCKKIDYGKSITDLKNSFIIAMNKYFELNLLY